MKTQLFKCSFILAIGLFMQMSIANAQTGVSINSTGNPPDAQSVLDITSSTKGVLLPRVADHTTITPTNGSDDGLMVYNTTTDTYWYWDASANVWRELPNTAGLPSVSLDDAYDGGVFITADAGAVDIQGAGGLYVNGPTGLGTSSPDGSYAATALNGAGPTIKVGSTTLGLLVESNAGGEDGISAIHSSGANTQAFYAIRGEVTNESGVGYLGYHTSSDNSYAVYGQSGTYAGYFDGDVNLTGELQLNGSAGTSGQVLMSAGSGSDAIWGTAAGDIESVTAGNALSGGGTSGAVTLDVTADNGLNIDVGNDMVQLGGDLTEATEIQLESFDLTLDLNGTGEFIVQDGNVDHFKVEANGDAIFGSDTYFKDTNTGGTDLVKISDAGGGVNDGRIEIFQDGAVNHTIHGDGDTEFNDVGADRNFRIESDNQSNMLFLDGGTDRLGLATGSPSRTLHVNGEARVQGLANAAGAVVLSDNNGNLDDLALTGSTADVLLGDGTFGPGSAFADHDWYQTGGTNTPTAIGDWIYTNGNVGINTGSTVPTNPLAALHVQSNIYVGDYNSAGFFNSNASIHVAKTNNPHLLFEDISDNTGGFSFDDGGLNITTENGDLNFRTGITFNGDFSSTGNSRVIIKNDGKVGIGTINPAQQLQVNVDNAGFNLPLMLRNEDGTIGNEVGIGFVNEGAGTWAKGAIVHERQSNFGRGDMHFLLDNTADNSDVTMADVKMTIQAGGNVGIGTTGPASVFHISTAQTGNVSKLHNPTLGNGSLVGHEFGKNNNTNNMVEFRYNHLSDGNAGNYANLGLWGNANTLIVAGTGNVGLGITAPAEKLHVVGNARISGLAGSGNVQADGNGTLIISNDIAAGDNDYIQNQNVADQAANFRISGDGQMDQVIATANGNWYMRGGDDHELRDVNVANTMGIWGRQNADRGGIQLGSDGSYIFGDNGDIGIGTTAPVFDLHVDGHIHPDGYLVVQNGVDGGSSRGIRMWTEGDANWGMYMGQSGAGRSFSGGTATAGGGFSAHAIRFRVASSATQGFIFENSAEQNLFSIRGNNGRATFRGGVLFNCIDCGSTTSVDGDGSSDWGDLSIQGRVLSANSNIHLSPPNGNGVIIDDTYRAAGGTGGGAAYLSVDGYITAGNPSTPSATSSTLWNWVYVEEFDNYSYWTQSTCRGSNSFYIPFFSGGYIYYEHENDDDDDWAYSPYIWIPANTSPSQIQASMSAYVCMETSWDGLRLELSINGGSWTVFNNFSSGGYNSDADNDCGGGHTAAWSNSGGANYYPVMDLDAAGVQPGDWVRVRLEASTDGSTEPCWTDIEIYSFSVEVVNQTNTAAFETGGIYAAGHIFAHSNSHVGDVAEYFPVSGYSEPGDLIALDPETPDKYVVSTSAYNPYVMGVYSTAPSVLVNSPDAGEPVGLSGRVPVKVTTENGEIKIGDYLTSSSTKGHAMKATKAGYTIGRALDVLDKETGTILCLIEPGWYNPSSSGNTSGGSFFLAKGQTTISVDDPTMTRDSRVFVSMLGNSGSTHWIEEKENGRFVVQLATPSIADVRFDYFIDDAQIKAATDILSDNAVSSDNPIKDDNSLLADKEGTVTVDGKTITSDEANDTRTKQHPQFENSESLPIMVESEWSLPSPPPNKDEGWIWHPEHGYVSTGKHGGH